MPQGEIDTKGNDAPGSALQVVPSGMARTRETTDEGASAVRSFQTESDIRQRASETLAKPIDGRFALALMFSTLRRQEGARIGAFGETEMGKTTLEKAIVFHAMDLRLSEFVLCHDVKGMIPEFPESLQLTNPATFTRRGGFLENEPLFVSFRGDVINDVECTVESVAKLSLEMARKGIRDSDGNWRAMPHMLVIDELGEAATRGKKEWASESALKCFTQGRKLGITTLWSTQSPRRCPFDAIAQSSSVAIFRLTGGDRNYLRSDTHELDALMMEYVSELPPGSFVLDQKGVRWDGSIYRLPKDYVDDMDGQIKQIATGRSKVLRAI